MILESELKAIVDRQRDLEERKPLGQVRPMSVNDALLDSHAIDITGVRRCGKSTGTPLGSMSTLNPLFWFRLNFATQFGWIR